MSDSELEALRQDVRECKQAINDLAEIIEADRRADQ